MVHDSSSQTPKYKQIADYLRGGIASNVYRTGEVLPSKRTLAIKLGVNPLTVQHAYDVLETEGLVVARKGVGMFVAGYGVVRAQSRSERACYNLLYQACRLARDANLPETQIQALMNKAMRKSSIVATCSS